MPAPQTPAPQTPAPMSKRPAAHSSPQALPDQIASPRKTGLIAWLQRLARRLSPSADLHRDDLVEGLTDSDHAHEDGFGDDERRFLKNVLIMRSRCVEDVMVRRAQIKAITADASLDDARIAFSDTNHSRLPVYNETLDRPVGFVHIKDVFRFLAGKDQAHDFNLGKIVHPVLFAPPSMKVTDLLRKMQADRLHMALIIDEHGGTSGLVSIEDLVEEIVGEIEDEHEKNSAQVRSFIRRRDGSIEASAHLRLDALKEEFGEDLHSEKSAADTLGGLAASLAGHVPQKGERVETSSGIIIEIRRADPRRVRTVRLYPPQKNKKSFLKSFPGGPGLTTKSQEI